MKESFILQGYEYAKEIYAQQGVDVDAAIRCAHKIPVSMHCWQGDGFHAFENAGALSGGIAVTGDYPGCPTTPEQLREDIDFTLRLFPGVTKLNLHSNYAEKHGKKIDRDAYTVNEFQDWLNWAKDRSLGLDFNPTFFSHPRMDGNFTLASEDKGTRDFWIEHGKRCREIGQEFGRQLGTSSIVNFWMPDGFKDIPAERGRYRERMVQSLDRIFEEVMPDQFEIDAIESKLFGFGIECYTVASHELSYGYAISRNKTYCIDMGHFHPTEDISDKLSSVFQYLEHVLLHTSRGVRWDSDHVVVWDDALQNVIREIVAGGYDNRVFIAQDYFDGAMNRTACWGIAMRNTRRAILRAFLEPLEDIRKAERSADFTTRLIRMEENKHLPYEQIWNYYCMINSVPVGLEWLDSIKSYERNVMAAR